MTPETKTDDTSFPHELIYLIAGRLDALGEQSKIWAQKIHNARLVYAGYGLLDACILPYSFFKYLLDVVLTHSDASSSDTLHDCLMTPAGIFIAAGTTIATIVFSMIANLYQDDDKDEIKRNIVIYWPYVRDVIKGLKNGYKGVRSSFQVISMLGGQSLSFLMLPAALLLGAISVANRLWYRSMKEKRKDMMAANARLLDEIKKFETLSAEECELFREKMKLNAQSNFIKRAAFVSSTYSGLVDSSYLYVGVLTICFLPWPALIIMAIFCVIFSLAYVAAKIYEEYDYQRKLEITHARIELELVVKEHGVQMQTLFAQLQELSKNLASDPKNEMLLQRQDDLRQKLNDKIKLFKEKRTYLQSLMTLSDTSAFFSGMKDGLAAYGALASMTFALAAILVISSTAFPPALLITCISVGMAMLIGFIAYSMIKNHQHRVKQDQDTNKPHDQLIKILQVLTVPDKKDKAVEDNAEKLKIEKKVKEIKIEEQVKEIIGSKIDPSPEFKVSEKSEVVRSFCSAFTKGPKAVDYMMNPLLDMDDAGHYHESPLMLGFAAVGGFLYAVTMALRALARGFGRKTPDQVPTSQASVELASIPDSNKQDDTANALLVMQESPSQDVTPKKDIALVITEMPVATSVVSSDIIIMDEQAPSPSRDSALAVEQSPDSTKRITPSISLSAFSFFNQNNKHTSNASCCSPEENIPAANLNYAVVVC